VLIADQVNLAPAVAKSTSVTDLMGLTVVLPLMIAATTIFARNARRPGMEKSNAPSKPYQDILGARPWYLHYNLWDLTTPFYPTVADWSETAIPLPPPPLSELNDQVVQKTIGNNPHLF